MRSHLVSTVFLALFLLGGCASKPVNDGGDQNTSTPLYPNYYLTDDNWPYKQGHDALWNMALLKCDLLADAQVNLERQACVVDLIRQSVPDNDFAAQYCASIESYVAHAGCLVSTSLSVDLQRRAGVGSDYAAFQGIPNTDYPWALGEAATNLARSIWQECGTSQPQRTCRENTAAKRLGMTSANQASCSTWKQDTEVVLCLLRLHIGNRMVEATRRFEAL